MTRFDPSKDLRLTDGQNLATCISTLTGKQKACSQHPVRASDPTFEVYLSTEIRNARFFFTRCLK